MSFLQFVEGPFFYVAGVIFLAGAAWKMLGLLRLGRKRDIAPPNGSATWGFIRGNLRHFVPRGIFTRRTWLHVLAGYSFHIALAVLVFFGAFHIAFIERFTGLSWQALPRWGFIIAADIAFAGLIALWVRRISDPVMRQITRREDHVSTILTFLVMLTGCLALQESHDSLRATHMLFVDIWLIYFPFSGLMHAFTFVLSRGHSGATYGRKGINL